ncbi:MAG: TlpA disulfide reductase family protein [Niabella sp.]
MTLKNVPLIICMLCLLNTAAAQTAFSPPKPAAFKALSVGDAIPDALWNLPLQVVNQPDGRKTITLGEYKDKLIILDFWNTTCTPCIKNFPRLHALQNEFGDKIKILAVTKEDPGEINRFFTTGIGKEYTYVNSVINDSTLSKYFPHLGVPHIAWINPGGKVENTTRAEDITQANIQAILDGQKTQMVSKIDIDRNRPLFLSEHFNDSMKLKTYSIFAKGRYPGLPSGGKRKRNAAGQVYGRQLTNLPIMDIYYSILLELFNRNGENFNLKRTIIEVREPALLNLIANPDGTFKNYNLYNYELIVPENKTDSLYYYMLADLNRYSDYIGTIEKRMMDCFVLVRKSVKDKIKSKEGKPNFIYSTAHSILINNPLSYLINLVNSDTFTKLPIIDETGYTDNVDIEISGVKDLASFKKELNRYDLDLLPAKRSLNMFILKDKQL